jgi:hypothetical protein
VRPLIAFPLLALVAGHGVLTPLLRFRAQGPAEELRAAGARKVAWEEGFDPLRAALAGRAEPLGFLAELPVDPARPSQVAARYYFAQFALAPVLLAREVDPRLTLADLPTKKLLEEALEERDLEVVERFSPGRALVRARRP